MYVHGCEGWYFDEIAQRTLNGTNAWMFTVFTGHSTHEEASSPSFDAVKTGRWRWLGLITSEDRLMRNIPAMLAVRARPVASGSRSITRLTEEWHTRLNGSLAAELHYLLHKADISQEVTQWLP